MASLKGFNAREVEPNTGFDPIPPGDYIAAIIDSEEKDTQAGTGTYHKLEFQILEGQYANRKLWVNLNLNNPSEEAVKIARGELSAICRAVNVLTPNDTVELHNLPMSIKVGVEKRKDTGEMQNRIKGYKPKGSAITPAPASGGSAPWQKKT
jgi:hypothetical protein